MTATRQVTWGEALVVEVFKADGGLKVVTDKIIREVGAAAPSRNTFRKLLKVNDPATLDDRDQWRAWLLLTALGNYPEDWGISDTAVPRSLDKDALRRSLVPVRRRGLGPRTRWLKGTYCVVNEFRELRAVPTNRGVRRCPKPEIVPRYGASAA